MWTWDRAIPTCAGMTAFGSYAVACVPERFE